MSPYSGFMYHGSPLLLSILGPLTMKRIDGLPVHVFCSLIFVIVDLITAMLIRAIGWKLLTTHHLNMQLLNLTKDDQPTRNLNVGELASLVFLWNPMTIVTCVGSSTSPIDNLMVVLAIYAACSRIPPLAAFGWVMATHLSYYPVTLVVPVILLLGYGLDSPPTKLFMVWNSNVAEKDLPSDSVKEHKMKCKTGSKIQQFSWKPVMNFLAWASFWLFSVLLLSTVSLKGINGLMQMFEKTCDFFIVVEDLSPNIGVFWYFFAEVFYFFWTFFLIVFHINIFFMILPLAIRLKHRPCFLAFVYIVISSMLKSYPSVGDSALYLGLLGLFANELKEMHFSFFLLAGYIGVSLLSPVMHNLWIWRGTGNANFYFATGIAYACLQTVLVVESVSTMLNYDRKLRKQLTT